MNLLRAAGMGAVSGLRSMSGLAVVSEAASRDLLRLKKTPLEWLGSDRAARITAFLAVGEMIADKTPFVPDRTGAASLLWRATAGAVCGYALAGQGRSRATGIAAALAGGLGALAASYAGLQYRRSEPSLKAAFAEDAMAIGSGAAIIHSVAR